MKRIRVAQVALIALMGILTACSTLRPLSTGRTLDGYLAKDIVVVLSEPYSFKPGLVTHSLPMGTYTPCLEDDEGVYFQAPSKLLMEDFIQPRLYDGGLFFKDGVSTKVYEYMIINDRPTKVKLDLPSDKFRIERKK